MIYEVQIQYWRQQAFSIGSHAWSDGQRTRHDVPPLHYAFNFMSSGGRKKNQVTCCCSCVPSYSGWIVLECMPWWWSALRILTAIGMKSWFRDVRTWTEAITFDSESCQTCSSCTDSTPSTSRIESRTPSREIVGGTPWSKMNDALRTYWTWGTTQRRQEQNW